MKQHWPSWLGETAAGRRLSRWSRHTTSALLHMVSAEVRWWRKGGAWVRLLLLQLLLRLPPPTTTPPPLLFSFKFLVLSYPLTSFLFFFFLLTFFSLLVCHSTFALSFTLFGSSDVQIPSFLPSVYPIIAVSCFQCLSRLFISFPYLVSIITLCSSSVRSSFYCRGFALLHYSLSLPLMTVVLIRQFTNHSIAFIISFIIVGFFPPSSSFSSTC